MVIAPKLDRLFRSALDALQVVEMLKARGVKLHLLDLGGDIAGNGLSKLFLTIAAAFAEAERDRIRRANRASEGRPEGAGPVSWRESPVRLPGLVALRLHSRGDGSEGLPLRPERDHFPDRLLLPLVGDKLENSATPFRRTRSDVRSTVTGLCVKA